MPVEITDFCWKYNLQRLQNLPEVQGCEAKLRHNADGTPYVTDNKNYIVDLYFKTPIKVLTFAPCIAIGSYYENDHSPGVNGAWCCDWF